MYAFVYIHAMYACCIRIDSSAEVLEAMGEQATSHIYIYIYINIYIYKHIHIQTCIYVCIYTYLYVFQSCFLSFRSRVYRGARGDGRTGHIVYILYLYIYKYKEMYRYRYISIYK